MRRVLGDETTEEQVDTATALSGAVASLAGNGQQGATSSPYRSAPAWGAAPSLRLYLVGYDPADPEPVRQALVSRGSVIVSYIPDDTWLVAAAPWAVRQAVAETGVQAVRRLGRRTIGCPGMSAYVYLHHCKAAHVAHHQRYTNRGRMRLACLSPSWAHCRRIIAHKHCLTTRGASVLTAEPFESSPKIDTRGRASPSLLPACAPEPTST